jgi:hypothetical protein
MNLLALMAKASGLTLSADDIGSAFAHQWDPGGA